MGMKRIVSKKGLALLVAALLVFALLPGAALAITADGGVETIDELTSAINAGGNVKLGTNIEITNENLGYKISGKSVVLDLNGFALTRAGTTQTALFQISNGGSLTITDSKGTGSITSSYPVDLWSNSTFVLNGGAITSPKGAAIDINTSVSDVQVKINGGSAIALSADNSFGIRGKSNIKVDINGGTISVNPGNRLAMYISGDKDDSIEINMTGGKVTAQGQAIQAYSGAVINVSGDAEIHSNSGVAISTQSGNGVVELNVKGGSITSDGSSYAVQAREKSVVNIEAGTISGNTAIYASDSATIQMSGGKAEGTRQAVGSSSSGTPTIDLTGGEFNKDVSKYVDADTSIAKVTSKDGTTYAVGKSINDKAAGVSSGDTIEVLQGNVDLENLPDGVTVKNSGSGTVSVNGEPVAPGEEVTVESELLYSIVKQPTDSIVTEGDAATFTVVAEGRDVMLGYQWRKSTDGGKTFKVIDGANAASYTTSATTLQNDGYQYDCIVFDANWQTVRANNAPSLTDADIKDMKEEQDYLRSKVVTLHVKEAGAEEPEPGEPVVPPTGDSPLLYAAIGAAVLCLLGLCLPALRKNRG